MQHNVSYLCTLTGSKLWQAKKSTKRTTPAGQVGMDIPSWGKKKRLFQKLPDRF